MIIIYEPWAKNEAHYEFNMNFLKIIMSLYPERKIEYYGERKQISLLKEEFNNKSIIFKEIEIGDYSSSDKKIKKIYIELFNIFKISRLKSEKVFITSALPQTIFFSKLFLRKKTAYYIMHGLLESLQRKYSYKNMAYYVRRVLKFRNIETHKYIVLGDSIKKNLLEVMPQLKENVISIDHPYSIKENTGIKKNKEFQEKIKMGTIGVGSKKKGMDKLNEISLFLQKNNIKNIELYHIGTTQKDIEFNEEIIVPFKDNGLIPRVDFEAEIEKLDYFIYLFSKDTYKLTASGSLFDAMSLGKPIVAIKNDYFQYIFNKIGNIGYLCENIQEIEKVIEKVSIEKNGNLYKEQQENLKKGLKFFLAENIAKRSKGLL